MGRKYIGPRLFLKKHWRKEPRWYIIDHEKQRSTGFVEHEKLAAEDALRDYIAGLPVGSRIPALRRYHRKRRLTGLVYFISTDDVPRFPIKVGFTAGDPAVRLVQLQQGCPYRLAIIGTIKGNQNTELDLLIRFSGDRLVGEWIRRSPALERYMNQMLSPLMARYMARENGSIHGPCPGPGVGLPAQVIG